MKKRNTALRMAAAMLLVVFMLGMGASALAASFTARINSSSARVYKVPSASSSAYVSGGKGVTVTVTGYTGSWARISYRGNTGYIKTKYLNLTNRPKAYTKRSTPVYRRASTSSGKMGTLRIATGVYVAGRDGGFYRIQNASGSVTGYVAAGNLTTRAKLMAAYNAWLAAQNNNNNNNSGGGSSGSSGSGSGSGSNASGSGSNSSGSTGTTASRIDKVIMLAKSLVGRPYSLDDNPPASFNCSSFVKYCMEKYGYSMANTAAAQAAMSNKVSAASIRKGDVLCFDTDNDGTCDHTAIYMGGNKFIEASEGAGKVQINTLNDWYESRLMHAIRPK